MMQKGRPLALGWYVFLACNVVLFHALAALGGQVPARQLAVSSSLLLATSLLVQVVLAVRVHAASMHMRNGRAAINRRTGEVTSRSDGADRTRRAGAAMQAAR